MPVILGPKFGPGFNGKPARMSEEDYAIWQRWWPNVSRETLAVYFDVGVGQGRAPVSGGSPGEIFMWLRNNQKRIDVIIERLREVWIVELRFAAQSSAIGRLKMYELLWDQEAPIGKQTQLVLVTDSEDPDVRQTAKSLGITYIVV